MKYKIGDIVEFHGKNYDFSEYACYLGYGVYHKKIDVPFPFVAEIIEITDYKKGTNEYKLKILNSNIVFADYVEAIEKFSTQINQQLELQF